MPRRLSTSLFLFMLCLNAATLWWGYSGTADNWGVDPDVPGEKHADRIEEKVENWRGQDTGLSFGSATFFIGLLIDIFVLFITFVVALVIAFPVFLMALGVPWWMVGPPTTVLYGVVMIDGFGILTGRV